jgi:Tc5 transposase DNA-binding domain
VKAQIQQRATNARYQAAVDDYLREQEKPVGAKKCGLCVIADKHKVKYRTLGRLVNRGQSISAFNASKRKLTYQEEHVLVDFILESADRACPLTPKQIKMYANTILAYQEKPGEQVGGSWVERFLERYRDELQTHWSSPLATERAKCLNKEAVQHWFELVEERLVKRGIKKHNIYRMDESGFPPSHQGMERVVGRQGSKIQHKSGSANRENVTALVTICANGSMLKPTIIFKGRNFMKSWGEDNLSEAS